MTWLDWALLGFAWGLAWLGLAGLGLARFGMALLALAIITKYFLNYYEIVIENYRLFIISQFETTKS